MADVDPRGADMDAGQAVHTVAAARLLELAARLAAPAPVGDDERILVEHRALEARPGAHVGADLLAREAGEDVGRRGEQAEKEVHVERGLTREHLPGDGGRVDEVHDPGAARRRGDEQPGRVLGALPRRLGARHGRGVEAHAGVAVALDLALHPQEQVGPNRLRAGEAAPHAAVERGDGEQADGAEDQRAGEEIHLLRPELEPEEVKPRVRHVGQHGLVRRVRPAVPADPGQDVVEAEEEAEHGPFGAPHGPRDALRVHLPVRGVEAGRGRRADVPGFGLDDGHGGGIPCDSRV